MKVVYLLIMLLITVVFPDVALATPATPEYDLRGGVQNIIEFLWLVIIISVLAFAIISFFKGEVVQSIVSAVIAGILIAVTNIGTLKALGNAILGFFIPEDPS